MFKQKTIYLAVITAVGGGVMSAAGPVGAQDQQMQRVEITGSAIKRIDAETAVPVTVIKVDELRKQGITSIEQVMSSLSAVQTQTGTSQTVGTGNGGASFANLRGLGENKTLVLLNGRRLANNAYDSSAPDLNMIPFAALERVEVLRDGASALYGTDAIGGVINFITRKDFTGGVVTVGGDNPQHSGGNSYNLNLGYGLGDLDKDRFNVWGFLDYQKQEHISGTQRPYGDRIVKTSPTTYPGTYSQDKSVTPSGCDLPNLVSTGPFSCGYITSRWVDYIPKTERLSGLLKGTLKLNEDHQLSLEYFASQSKVSTLIAPVPYGALTISPGSKYYPGNGITPAAPAGANIDPTQDISVRWRDVPNGGRQDNNVNQQQRLVASLEGALAGWDYQTALSYNVNKVTSNLIGGYTNGDTITAGVADGTLNPFGDQSPAGTALLNNAYALGTLQQGQGTVANVDVRGSREIGDWLRAGRQAAIAVGAEFRHEKFEQTANFDYASLVASSTGIDPATNNIGDRNVSAVYAELNVPLLRTLDVTAAVRYDKYSDFGSTTNPKLSFRFQPIQQILLRGSYSTGFRAPSLYDLHAANAYTNTASNWNDPVRCPNGKPIAGAAESSNCEVQFMSLTGGNTALKPEKSRNTTFGIAFEPTQDATIGLDFWWISLRNQINALDDNTVFTDPVKFAALFKRAPDGSLSTDGSQCPGPNCGYVQLTQLNLGGVNTNGFDLSGSYRLRTPALGTFDFSLVGTYVTKYEYQNEEGGEWIQNAGIYSGAYPIFRWQHTLTAAWRMGQWGAGITNHFKTGYLDQDPSNHVASYATWDVFGSWQPVKPLSLVLGVRNLFDRDPPFSNQTLTFQTGYDPRFSDAYGRVIYIRGTYTF